MTNIQIVKLIQLVEHDKEGFYELPPCSLIKSEKDFNEILDYLKSLLK